MLCRTLLHVCVHKGFFFNFIFIIWLRQQRKKKVKWKWNADLTVQNSIKKCFWFQWTRSIQHWLWLFTSCIIHSVISFYRCVFCATIKTSTCKQNQRRLYELSTSIFHFKPGSSYLQHYFFFLFRFYHFHTVQSVLCRSLLFDIRTTTNNGILNLFAKDVEWVRGRTEKETYFRVRNSTVTLFAGDTFLFC